MILRDIAREGGEYVSPEFALAYRQVEQLKTALAKTGDDVMNAENTADGTNLLFGKRKVEAVPDYSIGRTKMRFGPKTAESAPKPQPLSLPPSRFFVDENGTVSRDFPKAPTPSPLPPPPQPRTSPQPDYSLAAGMQQKLGTITQGTSVASTRSKKNRLSVPPMVPTGKAQPAPDASVLHAVDQGFLQTQGKRKQLGRWAHTHLVSGQLPLEQASKLNKADNPSIEAAVQLARQSGGTVDRIAQRALVDRSGKELGGSYRSLMETIPKDKRAAFNDYAQNLHNIARQQQGKPVNANTAEQSAALVATYEAAHSDFRKTADSIQAWWNTFGQEWLVGSGMVSREGFETMRQMYPYYVPTFRVDKQMGTGSGLFGKRVSTPNVVGKAKGGTSEIVPLEESFMARINGTVKAARRNELGQAILAFARSDPETAARNGILLSKQSGGTLKPSDLDSLMDSVERGTLQELENGGYRLSVLEQGQKVEMDLSRDVWSALKTLQDNGLEESFVYHITKSITQPIKTAITGVNALFAITNTLRDFQTYFVNSIEKNPLKLLSSYGKGVSSVLVGNTKDFAVSKFGGRALGKWAEKIPSDLYDAYKGQGGARSGFYGAQQGFEGSLPKKFSELSIPKKAGKVLASPFNAFAKVGEFTEQVPRMAEYRNAIRQFGDTPEGHKRAAQAAADVTVNFSRSGTDGKMLDAWTLYLNAAMQGLDKLARQTNMKPVSTLSKGALLITLPAVVLNWVNKDNPNYQELDDRTRDSYFLIPNQSDLDDDGKAKTFLKIPRSREWGAVLGASVDRFAQFFESGDLAESFDGFGATISTSLAPPNPITDSVLAPLLINLPMNKDFAGRSIVPKSMEDLSPQNQYDISTSGAAKGLASLLNYTPLKASPKQIDYLISSYGGYPGSLLQAATSPQNKGDTAGETIKNSVGRMFKQPLERRFIANPLYSNAAVDEFYTALDEARTLAKDKNFEEDLMAEAVTPEEKRVSHLDKASDEIAQLRKQEKELLAKNMLPEHRQLEVDKLRRQMNNVAKSALAQVDSVVEDYEKWYVPELSHLSEEKQEAAKT